MVIQYQIVGIFAYILLLGEFNGVVLWLWLNDLDTWNWVLY